MHRIGEGGGLPLSLESAMFKVALKTLSTKLTKAPGKDGAWNWMLFTSGEVMQREILELLNKCWEEEGISEEWFHTLVPYIYKGKGNENELTSYRPVGLSSAIVNLFKKVWLNRIVPIIMRCCTFRETPSNRCSLTCTSAHSQDLV